MGDLSELEQINEALRDREAAEQDFVRARSRMIKAQAKYDRLSNAYMAKLMQPAKRPIE